MLKFYSEFDFDTFVVDISTKFGPFIDYSEYEREEEFSIPAIIDPITHQNAGQSSFKIKDVLYFFLEIHRIFQEKKLKYETICFGSNTSNTNKTNEEGNKGSPNKNSSPEKKEDTEENKEKTESPLKEEMKEENSNPAESIANLIETNLIEDIIQNIVSLFNY